MPNRLALEASPYLLQHANNPVDWYPWGPEALDRARREDKPILLSIGYSACHWCHVMERESFEDAAIAASMNEKFVNVKVDREERPDLDQVYQLVVQLTGRSGGWPLTVFLTPDQRPFFGGTYFPPRDRHGMPGFPKVLESVWEAYRLRRGEVDAHAGELEQAIAEAAQVEGGGGADSVTPAFATAAAERLAARFDPRHGGFGHRPKFPNATCLDVLLRVGDVGRARRALDAMRAGGIWDHLGSGFHRYSTDERWLVPHFEKMLYDNAQLLGTYTDAWRLTRDPLYARTARGIAAYVAREMTSPGGGFYATQDADSEGEEGKFFVWTPAEVDAACAGDAEAAAVAKAYFDVTARGNFEESGATVLSTPAPLAEVAARVWPGVEVAEGALERARRRMFEARERRPRPSRDEKVLASWNGLMAGALARAGAALDDPGMVRAATRAMEFVVGRLVVRESGTARVMRHVKGDAVRGPGFLDDHAYVGDAAVDLYEATGDARWVALARGLAESILARFHDPKDGGFFFTPDDGEKILVRTKDSFDHAVPSGSAVACRLLLRLGTLADEAFAVPATRAIEALAPSAAQNPMGMSVTVGLVDRLARGSVDVVVVGSRTSEATRALVRAAAAAYLPDRVLAWVDPEDPASLEACAALGRGKPAEDVPVAYVCRGRTCSRPVRDGRELERALGER